MMGHIEYLRRLGACTPGLEFAAKYSSAREAWEKCQIPEWMFWLLKNAASIRNAKQYRLYACWCVRNTPIGDGRTTWDLLADERSRRSVAVTEMFARGHATLKQLADAWYAARDAAEAAAEDAASGAVRDSALAYAEAAAWAATRGAADDAARAAARAAASGAVRDSADAWNAARGDAEATQANKIREMFADEFNEIEKRMQGE